MELQTQVKVEPSDDDYPGDRSRNLDVQPKHLKADTSISNGLDKHVAERALSESSALSSSVSSLEVAADTKPLVHGDRKAPVARFLPLVKLEVDVDDFEYCHNQTQSELCPQNTGISADGKPHDVRTKCPHQYEEASPKEHGAPFSAEFLVKVEPDFASCSDRDGVALKAATNMAPAMAVMEENPIPQKADVVSECPDQSQSKTRSSEKVKSQSVVEGSDWSKVKTGISSVQHGSSAISSVQHGSSAISSVQHGSSAISSVQHGSSAMSQTGKHPVDADEEELESLPVHFMSESDDEIRSSETQTENRNTPLYHCNVCPKAYWQLSQLQEHMAKHNFHVCKRSVRCGECGKVFERCSLLKIHVVVHTGVKYYQCDSCTSQFSRSTTLRKHKRLYHSSEKPEQWHGDRAVCDLCQKTFSSSSSLKTHLIRHSEARPYKCDLCPKEFKLQSCLNRHRRLHSGNKPYQCEQCSAAFAQYFNLSQHVKSLHSNERPFKCDHCSGRFKIASDLKRHQRVHAEERQYKCPMCPAEFSASSSLHKHKQAHSCERPFKCDQCTAQYQFASDLKVHKEIHDSADRPVKCDECNARFKHVSYLRIHKRVHDSKDLPQSFGGDHYRPIDLT